MPFFKQLLGKVKGKYRFAEYRKCVEQQRKTVKVQYMNNRITRAKSMDDLYYKIKNNHFFLGPKDNVDFVNQVWDMQVHLHQGGELHVFLFRDTDNPWVIWWVNVQGGISEDQNFLHDEDQSRILGCKPYYIGCQ